MSRGSRIPIRNASVLLDSGGRSAQEDFALVNRERGVFVVADGFGGPEPGQRAARTACEAVKAFLEREAGDDDATMPFVLRKYLSLAGNVLFNALIHANRSVWKKNQGKSVYERGGASVLAAYLDGDLLAIANVGGCQARILRDGGCAELVIPRTYGRPCEPLDNQEKAHMDAPLMAVGISEDLEPEIFEYRVRSGDWIILHTDGLNESVIERMLRIKQKEFKPDEAARRALDETLKDTGGDNLAMALTIF